MEKKHATCNVHGYFLLTCIVHGSPWGPLSIIVLIVNVHLAQGSIVYRAWKKCSVHRAWLFLVGVHRARTHHQCTAFFRLLAPCIGLSLLTCIVHIGLSCTLHVKKCYVHCAWLFFVNMHRARTPQDGPHQCFSGSLTCIVHRGLSCTVHGKEMLHALCMAIFC